MKIKWITHASFQVKTDSGKVIYFDPYELEGSFEKADIILCSHDHYDHLSPADIKQVSGKNTTVIIPKVSTVQGDFRVIKLDAGEKAEVGDIKVEAVPAYTISLQTHPKKNRWLGYILEAEGKRIYHAGDTGKIPEMADFKNITVACLPVGGMYTMGFEEATESAVLIKPQIVVPMHNWGKDMVPFKKMVESRIPGLKVEILTGRDLEI